MTWLLARPISMIFRTTGSSENLSAEDDRAGEWAGAMAVDWAGDCAAWKLTTAAERVRRAAKKMRSERFFMISPFRFLVLGGIICASLNPCQNAKWGTWHSVPDFPS